MNRRHTLSSIVALVVGATVGCMSQDTAMATGDEAFEVVDFSQIVRVGNFLERTPGGLWYAADSLGNPVEPNVHDEDLLRRISERSGREGAFAPLDDVRAELAELAERGEDAQPGPACGNE